MNIVSDDSTRRWIGAQTNLSEALRSSAPGSKPASHAIWNPLQNPTTGPPLSACLTTSRMIGLKRAIAPARR